MSLNELHELRTGLLSQLEAPPNITALIKQYQVTRFHCSVEGAVNSASIRSRDLSVQYKVL